MTPPPLLVDRRVRPDWMDRRANSIRPVDTAEIGPREIVAERSPGRRAADFARAARAVSAA